MGIKGIASPATIRKTMQSLYAMSFLVSIASSAMYGIILPLYLWSLGISFTELGFTLGAFAIAISLAGIFFGLHSDVVGRRPYLILSLAISTIVTLLFTQARSLLHFAILQVIGGISSSLYNIIVPALLTDLTKDIERGGRFGRLGGFGWLGSGLGYLVAGIILATFGFFSAFIFVAMLSLVACIIVQLFVFSHHLPSKEVFTPAVLKG